MKGLAHATLSDSELVGCGRETKYCCVWKAPRADIPAMLIYLGGGFARCQMKKWL